MDKIFDFPGFSQRDRELSTLRYVGNDIKCKICVVAATKSACTLLSHVVNGYNPIGFFVVGLNEVINPIEYANGESPDLKIINSYRYPVFRIGETILVHLADPNLPPHKPVSLLLDLTAAQEIFILNSSPESEFIGDAIAPSLFILSPTTSELPLPNRVTGIAAGMLLLAPLHKANPRVLHLIEPSSGLNRQAMLTWSAPLNDFLLFDF